MPQTPLSNRGLNYEHDLGADDWKNSYDANWVILDTLGGGAFVNNFPLAAEPMAPAVGDAYILDAAPTGTNWGSDTGAVQNSIALYTNIPGQADSSPWLYLVPREGWRVWDRTNDRWVEWNGSAWVADFGTLATNLNGFGTPPSITLRWALSGRQVSLFIPTSTPATSNATTMTTATALPAYLRPGVAQAANCRVLNNGANAFGSVEVSTGGILTFRNGAGSTGGFTASGNKGTLSSAIVFNRA